MPGQLGPFTGNLKGVPILEGHLRCRPGRVVVPQQEPPGLLVPDANDVAPEQRGRAGVVGVVMRVDEVRHGVGTPSAAAISSTARRRLWPMSGGASNST